MKGRLVFLSCRLRPFGQGYAGRFSGGDGGVRTPGLCIANAPLSQLSYIPSFWSYFNDFSLFFNINFKFLKVFLILKTVG